MRTRLIRFAALAVPLLLALASCGDDDASTTVATAATSESATSGPTTAPPTTEPPTIEPPTTEPPTTAKATTAATTNPPTTTAPPVDAVELMTSLQLVSTDYSPDHSILTDVTDLPSSPSTAALIEAVAATPECAGLAVQAPFPHAMMSSGALIEFISAIGATSSASLIVLADTAAAAAFMEAVRSEERYPTCLLLATLKTLVAPPGITLDLVDFRFLDALPGYGDDQVIPAGDLVISQDGAVLITVVGGTRFSRIGKVILAVGGVSPTADAFAVLLYERTLTALESR